MKERKKHEVFEVYICRYDGEIVYIGEGKKGRHRHCNSGGSHVAGLNELYFLGDRSLFDIEVFFFRTKGEAKSEQDSLISLHKPRLNIVGVSDTRQSLGGGRNEFKRLVENKIYYSRFNTKVKVRMRDSFAELLNFHTLKQIDQDGGLYLRNHLFYKRLGFESISTLLHSLATHKTGCLGYKELFRMIKNVYFEVYKQDLVVKFLKSGEFVEVQWLSED